MKKLGFLILICWSGIAFSQEILVPFRVGDLFGLSDVKGNLKVKPAYDYIEPIGEGYYKYSNFTKFPDTIHWVSGRIEIREKTKTVTGVLFGTKIIIKNSPHRHFTVVKNALLIGSEESYISKNSNFYNLKGKKLLSENVEKFKFLANDRMRLENTPVIAVFAEHFDKTFSVLLYDTKRQEFVTPLISHGQNVKLERRESTEDYIVLSYNDEKYNSYKVSIYFDDKKNTFVKEPFSYNRDIGEIREGIRGDNNVVVESPGYQGDRGPAGDPDGPVKYNSTKTKPVKPAVIPKKVYPFIRVNDSLYTYNGNEIKPSAGEKILFAERYNKSQMQPLIFTEGGKFGLIISDSLRSQVLYDSLRYIKNQYSIFSAGYSMLYLAGKKNDNNKLVYGIIDDKGNEIIPIVYDYVSPNLLEIYQPDNEGQKKTFEFRQPYNYSNDK
ncbi:MAG: WG repeat-containing protein, partial [Ferruginibacter sp.]